MAVSARVFLRRGISEDAFVGMLRIDFPEMGIDLRPFSITAQKNGDSVNLIVCRDNELIFTAYVENGETEIVPAESYGVNFDGIDHGIKIWMSIHVLVEAVLQSLEELAMKDPGAVEKGIFVEGDFEELAERDHEVVCLMCRRKPPVLTK